MVSMSGVRRTTLGFVVALFGVLLIVAVNPAADVPGLEQAAPREIPVAVVGPQPEADTTRDALNSLAGYPVAAQIRASEDLARQNLHDRSVGAILLLGSGGSHRLVVASAASELEATKVEQVITDALALSGQRVTIEDAVPASTHDPDGLVSFRFAASLASLGVVFAGLLGLVFGARSSAPQLVMLRFGGLALGAAVAATAATLVATHGSVRVDAGFWPLVGFGVLVVLGVGSATLALTAWFGLWGWLAAMVVFVLLGIPGALGAWPLSSLSSVWPTMLAWLPPGAAAWAVRGIAYFDGAGIGQVVVMLALWFLIGLVTTTAAVVDNDDDPRARRFHPQLRRHPVVASATGLGAIALLVVVPAASSFTRTDLGPVLTVDCEPFPTPRTIDQLNDQVDRIRVKSGFVGGDVGASTQVGDGRQLFVFGDTIRTPGYGDQGIVRNSMLVFDDGCLGSLVRRDKGAIVPDRADGVGYWPMSIASVEVRGHEIVGELVQRVRSTGKGDFDFENLGGALAVYRVDRNRPPVLQRVVDFGPDDADSASPTWGAAAAVAGDTVYLYGTSRIEDGGFGWAVSVARAKLTDLPDQKRWRYWDGSRWSAKEADAAKVIDQDGGVSQTFSVFREGDTWYALSKRSDFIGTDLVVWTAPAPTGPFTAGPVLAEIPSTDSELRYMPLAHADLLPKAGTMVVSVSRNTTDTEQIQSDPSRYRPEFLRVTLPKP